MNLFSRSHNHSLDAAQRFSLVLMAALVLLTFVGTNLQALLWQSSDWLVSTVLPAVVIDLTNDERGDNAVAPLQRNTTLDAAARAKAQHMADNEYFAHYAPDGTTPWNFFKDEGYVYAHAGENLAIHFTDSAEVVEAWMLSPTHKKNIVDGKFTEIGVGTAKGTFDGYNTVYVVQLFGTPAVAAAPAPTPVVAERPPVPKPVALAQATPEPLTSTPVVEAESVPAVLPAETTIPVEIPAPEPERIIPTPAPIESELSPEKPTTVPTLATSAFEDVVIIETQLATSSGLAVAMVTEPASSSHAGATIASVATRPNLVLDGIYAVLFAVIIMSLLAAMVVEARRMHYLQVAYSIALLLVMGGLWFVHTTLTGGAVIA